VLALAIVHAARREQRSLGDTHDLFQQKKKKNCSSDTAGLFKVLHFINSDTRSSVAISLSAQPFQTELSKLQRVPLVVML
jgi:hypothetical protein